MNNNKFISKYLKDRTYTFTYYVDYTEAKPESINSNNSMINNMK